MHLHGIKVVDLHSNNNSSNNNHHHSSRNPQVWWVSSTNRHLPWYHSHHPWYRQRHLPRPVPWCHHGSNPTIHTSHLPAPCLIWVSIKTVHTSHLPAPCLIWVSIKTVYTSHLPAPCLVWVSIKTVHTSHLPAPCLVWVSIKMFKHLQSLLYKSSMQFFLNNSMHEYFLYWNVFAHQKLFPNGMTFVDFIK